MSKSEKIASLLKPEHIVLDISATAKTEALREVASVLEQDHAVNDFNTFFQEILQREKVSNTALGHDVAIPHARTDQCQNIVIAVGRSIEGIDFEAKDGGLVRLIFLIGTPKAMVTDYLRVVGNLARLLRHEELRQQLLEAPNAASFIQALDAAES